MFRPPSLLASQVAPTAANVPQGSRGFYIRAYRASLPLHAPDMLPVRIQAIDRKRTSTFLDLQPCRPLRVPHQLHQCGQTHASTDHVGGKGGSKAMWVGKLDAGGLAMVTE